MGEHWTAKERRCKYWLYRDGHVAADDDDDHELQNWKLYPWRGRRPTKQQCYSLLHLNTNYAYATSNKDRLFYYCNMDMAFCCNVLWTQWDPKLRTSVPKRRQRYYEKGFLRKSSVILFPLYYRLKLLWSINVAQKWLHNSAFFVDFQRRESNGTNERGSSLKNSEGETTAASLSFSCLNHLFFKGQGGGEGQLVHVVICQSDWNCN